MMKINRGIDDINKVKAQPKINFLWHGIPEGSKGLISGVSKTGKTTFAENLAISLAVGKKSFFGFDTIGKPQKVLFINLEESLSLRAKRNDNQISILNKEEQNLFNENYFTAPEKLNNYIVTESDWELLEEYIELINPDVIFIDSLTHMFEGEIENSSACVRFFKKLDKYVLRFNKSLIIIHHNIKGNDKPITQSHVSGSRVVLQNFEYVYGLANTPNGESYLALLNNKHIAKDDTTAYLYNINQNGWVDFIMKGNKNKLYQTEKYDMRKNTNNIDLIYNYIKDNEVSITSQGSQGIKMVVNGNMKNTGSIPCVSANELNKKFVKSKRMAKQTLYNSLHKLIEQKKIYKIELNKYSTYA